jgi:methylenetetrahydrofolate dehydrogenase (NADP+)/methenyltetrahydrofolate cyclohydrolase
MLTIIADRAEDRADAVRAGDIVISGVGKPGLIRGDMIKKGAVVIDAGSSESSGAVVGDADRNSVASSAAYLAPVPGGVGPLTVAMLLKNLFILARA